MKKLVCLLAVIALAASASVAIDVIKNGVFQGPWTAGDYTVGTAEEGTPAAYKVRTSPGWISTGASGTVTLAGNEYIEFDLYLDNAQAGTHVEAMHLEVNGDGGWSYKWQQNCDTWVDGVHYASFDSWNVTLDAWHHIKVDLKDNCGPLAGPTPIPLDLYNDNIGLIRLHTHWPTVGTAVYISNMAFTPEPATIALLGLGGLALIRRRR